MKSWAEGGFWEAEVVIGSDTDSQLQWAFHARAWHSRGFLAMYGAVLGCSTWIQTS